MNPARQPMDFAVDRADLGKARERLARAPDSADRFDSLRLWVGCARRCEKSDKYSLEPLRAGARFVGKTVAWQSLTPSVATVDPATGTPCLVSSA
jgi:hypothetical protein